MKNLEEERKAFESLGSIYPNHHQVIVEKVTMADVTSCWFIPDVVVSKEIVIYFHGGGFIYGSIRSHSAMVSHIASAIGRKILFVEYSLAPEKPFPFALNEATAVIDDLLHHAPDTMFALMGDSAGGNLVMSTALNLKDLNMQLPIYQVLISPWVNMETDYASYHENERLDPIITKEFVKYAASHYAGDHSLSNPLVSPALGSFIGFSPTLIMVGAKEVLRDDAVHLHQALKKTGSTSVLKMFDDVTHVWTLTNISSNDSKEALRTIKEFAASVSSTLVI
jgi:acetyl esterase/lipase